MGSQTRTALLTFGSLEDAMPVSASMLGHMLVLLPREHSFPLVSADYSAAWMTQLKDDFLLEMLSFFLFLFRVAPAAHGSFQARDLIGATAAGLLPSYTTGTATCGSEQPATYTIAHGNARSPT